MMPVSFSASVEVNSMLKEKVFGRLFVVVFAGFLGIPAAAQLIPPSASETGLGGSNTITGTVLTSMGGRLERRVSIRLQTMTKGDRVTTTDEYGNFAFRGLVSGDYTLVIDKEKDFEPFSQTITIIQVRGFPGQTNMVSIRLTPKVNTQPKPGVVDAALATLPERGKTLFTKSQDLAKAGDHRGAIEQLTSLTTEFPSFMFGFNELGVEYLRLGQLDKAEAAFRAAIKIEPLAFAPQMNRGMTLVEMKRYADAEPVLRSAKKLNEQPGVVHYFLGQAVANLGKFDEAEKELTAAVSMGGDEMKEAHRILAIIYSSKGDKKRAASELETYLNLAPHAKDAESLRNLIRRLKGEDTPAAVQSTVKP